MADAGYEIEQFLMERNKAFEEGDLQWAAAQLGIWIGDVRLEIAFHKARAACMDVSEARREESRQWLLDNGYKRFGDE